MVSRYRRVTNPDSLQFCREARATAICFAKQIAAHNGARASCSPLRIKGHAYSDTAGHKHQHHEKDTTRTADQSRVKVVEKTDDRPRVEVIEKRGDRY